MDEISRVRGVYASYDDAGRSARWQDDRAILEERARLVAGAIASLGLGPAEALDVLDLGCGRGTARTDLERAGVDPRRTIGIELVPGRARDARATGLAVAMASGDALPLAAGSVDLVVAFTVLSSIHDIEVMAGVEAEVRRVLRPGGALLVYDMRLPSPSNRTVRPLGRTRLGRVFPGWSRRSQSCTLLPPLARRVAPDPGPRYDRLAAVRVLRSHTLSVLRPPVRPVGMGLPDLPSCPTVSVVMPVRNEGAFIDTSLGAVLSQVDVDPPQVIVVDGRSDDDTTDRVTQMIRGEAADVVLLDNPRQIVPVSMNMALAAATGDVVIRVDGHCVIAPDYVRRCIDALRSTGAECVGGPMSTVGETSVARSIAAAQSSTVGVGGVAFRTSNKATFVDTVAFGAYRRDVFSRIGVFDEDLVRNQDDELNLRLTRAGGRIWMDPTVTSTYFSRGTLRGLWRQYHGYGFYKVRVMRKHRTVPSPRHLAPAAFVAGAAGAAGLSVLRRSPWPASAVGAPYALAIAVASLTTARRTRTQPAVVATAIIAMHVAYGSGWWAGLVRELQRDTR